jgi:hypothetical protein
MAPRLAKAKAKEKNNEFKNNFLILFTFLKRMNFRQIENSQVVTALKV